MKKIHFGCGHNILPEWENLDLPQTDVRKKLPYKDNTVDFIFHEHLIEHLDEVDGFNFLKECYRILKTDGVMRISCPSIEGIISVYQNWDKLETPWKNKHFNNKNSFINSVIYSEAAGYKGKKFNGNGEIITLNNTDKWHKHMYDPGSFTKKLSKIGFREIIFTAKHQSQYPELRSLERRLGGKFSDYPPELDLTLEAKK